MIEVRNLSYSIGNKEILHDISFTVEEGSITCIVGPNGCGKSTLLSHISRRLPSKNAIFLKGKPIESIPRRDYARETAVMVQQSMDMTGELTAGEVVLMGRYPFKKRFAAYSRRDHELAEEALRETGAWELKDKEMKHMSGGEKQRVLIAKVFAQDPKLLLMDEPTNHLDVKYKLALMENLKHFKSHPTVIIVLHDLSLAARYCDHAVLMKKGRLVMKGPSADVLTAEHLDKLFDVHFYSAEHDGKRFLYC